MGEFSGFGWFWWFKGRGSQSLNSAAVVCFLRKGGCLCWFLKSPVRLQTEWRFHDSCISIESNASISSAANDSVNTVKLESPPP